MATSLVSKNSLVIVVLCVIGFRCHAMATAAVISASIAVTALETTLLCWVAYNPSGRALPVFIGVHVVVAVCYIAWMLLTMSTSAMDLPWSPVTEVAVSLGIAGMTFGTWASSYAGDSHTNTLASGASRQLEGAPHKQ